MTLQSDLRESRLRFDTIKKKMLMYWLATDQNDLQAFPEIFLGKGGELKQEKIKRPITVSHFKLEFFFGRSGIWNVDFSHLKRQSRRHVPLNALRVICI